MIVSSDVIRLGFSGFDRDPMTLRDLNSTVDDIKALRFLEEGVDDDNFQEYWAFTQSVYNGAPNDAPPSESDKQAIRNYYLLRAVMMNDAAGAQEAIRLGADINEFSIVNGRRGCPLIRATTNGNMGIVRMLVESGADVNIMQLNGENSIAIASSLDYYEIAEYLLKHHADPNVRAHGGLTPLALAENSRMVKLLLDNGADPNIPDSDGDLPIIARIDNGDVASVELLIEAGTDIDRANKVGISARMHGRSTGNYSIRTLMG